ncbi:MAG: glycosyltransferase [Desulfovibrio sp.]
MDYQGGCEAQRLAIQGAMACIHYEARVLREGGRITDLAVRFPADGRELHCWGRAGEDRERKLAETVPRGALPVLLGAGLGICLELLAARGPVVVVDREAPLLAASGIRERFGDHENICWLFGDTPEVLHELQDRQRRDGRPLHFLRVPLYLRLDPGHYRVVLESLAPLSAGCEADLTGLPLWARHPRFTGVRPRVLLLRRKYFLYSEIESALKHLGVPFAVLDVQDGERVHPRFIEDLLLAVAEFRPDFLLTVNHFGLDREGRLAGLLEEARLPLASWFVDSPELILHNWPGQNRPNIAVFSFDAGSLEFLHTQGFSHAAFLPLATDPERFAPGALQRSQWRSPVSFVGESITGRVCSLMALLRENSLGTRLAAAGEHFAKAEARSAGSYLREHLPDLAGEVAALPQDKQLAAESLVTFSAARLYRIACLRRLAPSPTLVVGDAAWADLLREPSYRILPRVNYYTELAGVYVSADVNFNCTSTQMKGAVNQRVFDVPACGAFLLTDERDQLARLFEPGSEAACYADIDEIPELLERWLRTPKERKRLVERARKRVLAQHTYELRLESLLAEMRAAFDARSVGGGNDRGVNG